MDAKESASICHAFMFHTLKLSYIKKKLQRSSNTRRDVTGYNEVKTKLPSRETV